MRSQSGEEQMLSPCHYLRHRLLFPRLPPLKRFMRKPLVQSPPMRTSSRLRSRKFQSPIRPHRPLPKH